MMAIKKLVFILFLCLLATSVSAKTRFIAATDFTGGGTGALDKVNGQDLSDGDIATVNNGTVTCHYVLDADSAATETGRFVIAPDSNAGDKRWIMVSGPMAIGTSNTATSGTGEDDLHDVSVVGNFLLTKKILRVYAFGTISGANDTKTIKLHFGASSWTIISAAAGDETDWMIEATIYNTSASTQRIIWKGVESDGTLTMGYETASVDTSADVILKTTGECANAGDTITEAVFHVDVTGDH